MTGNVTVKQICPFLYINDAYSSNEEFSAATAEVTEATTAITTAIMMIKSPPANKKNIPFILKTPFYR